MSVEEIFTEEELLDIKAAAYERHLAVKDVIHQAVMEDLVR